MEHGFLRVAAATPKIKVADCELTRSDDRADRKSGGEQSESVGISGTLYNRIYL